jgi:hypothetical protein
MRVPKGLWMLGFLGILGCTTNAPRPAIASATTPAVPRGAEAAPSPAATVDAPLLGDEAKRAELVKARTSFETFISHADGRPEYAAAVAKAKERIEDIDRILIFMDGGAAAP